MDSFAEQFAKRQLETNMMLRELVNGLSERITLLQEQLNHHNDRIHSLEVNNAF